MRLFEETFIHEDVKDIHKKTIVTVKTGRAGKEITCLGGSLWITQEGDGIDRILTPGETYQTRISGNIIIEGLDHSQIRISRLQKADIVKNYQNGMQIQPACA